MKNETKKVLIIEDEETPREELQSAFRGCKDLEFEITTAENTAQAESALQKFKFDVITIDLKLGSKVSAGLSLMERNMILAGYAEVVKIVVTGYPTYERCVQAMRLGAWDFIDKVGDYAGRAVRSSVTRLRELEEIQREERYIFDEWLPEHEQFLQKEHPGEFVAVKDGKVVAHGHSMIALGASLSVEPHVGGRLPYILHIRQKERHD